VTSPLSEASAQLLDTAPLVRRAVGLDPRTLVRIRLNAGSVTSFVRLPFGVLVGRTVKAQWDGDEIDSVVTARELLAWLDGATAKPPASWDPLWRGPIPPGGGWRRVETIPDAVVRNLVRKGASALQEAAEREGVPGSQPRAEVADALLDSVVVTAQSGELRAEVTLRTMSAVTRMGFMPAGSRAAIDLSGRWLRVAAEFGSVYAERRGSGLAVLSGL
jgi:hypothetical protein